MLIAMLLTAMSTYGKSRQLPLVLQRTFEYKKSVAGQVHGTSTNVYSRYTLFVERRNPMLFAVPTLYVIARGDRQYISESYSRLVFRDIDKYDAFRQVNVNTVPRHRRTMPTLIHYMTPNLYNVTLIQDHLLSPFHPKNAPCYKYKSEAATDSTTRVTFKSKIKNTQLVTGEAFIENATGRIISATLNGEYDMLDFTLYVEMGPDGVASLLPHICDMKGKFIFMGNRLRFNRHSVYGLGTFLPDSIREKDDRALMESLRPDCLNEEEKAIYHIYDSIEDSKAAAREAARLADTTTVDKKRKYNFVKDFLWDVIGDNIVNRIRVNYGGKDKGSFRIGPIFNPLYFSYSDSKGLVYKFDVQTRYNFTPNRFFYFRFKSGYAMKQRRFYFNIPIQFMYNQRRNANVRIDISGGQRIYNSSILDDIKSEGHDSLDLDNMKLDYFHDTEVRMNNNYDISDNWSVQGGFVYHHRYAFDKSGFKKLGRSPSYHTFAPTLQVQYRPKGWRGPALTLNWERSFKGFLKSDMGYEKWEADASLQRQFHRMRSLAFRVGYGVYTSKAKHSYFLDFNNFRDEKIPGGWNDDWSGEFQVLNRNYYNMSNYYVRTNTTFETPLLILSRVPWAGHYVELERIYVSTLFAKELHPYTEYGYGFTNRLFSIGVFMGMKNFKFDRIGCEFDFELFRRW
ncbi:MAG: hypothetical protein J5506_09270 [Prevotella sp.]|nr:hypothetical protein [Prevotella sp.]